MKQDLPSNMILQSNGDIKIKIEKSNLDEEDKDDDFNEISGVRKY